MHAFCVSALAQENLAQENSAQESVADKELEIFKREVKKRFDADQKARWDLIHYSKVKSQDPEHKMELLKKASDIDGENVEWLRKLIKQFGWPSSELFTQPEREQFFALVLHADRDRKFQKKCLKLMKGLEAGQWQVRYHRLLEARLKLKPPRKVKLPK